MRKTLPIAACVSVALVASAAGQIVRTWTSNSDQRWSRSSNWSGNNVPGSSNEVAQFGTGLQLNPQLNSSTYTVRGISFSAGAPGYDVGDNNGARTLKIGNGTSGFIENLSASDQLISIATLQFQNDATITTASTGGLTLSSNLTGTNRSLTFDTTGDVTVSGNITTGSGAVTKQGTGNLNLSGANTYTGQTTINAGAIVLAAANVFADTGAVSLATAGSLRLNNLSDSIGSLGGSGTVDFGNAGTGSLTLAAGTSTFSGSFTGSGELVIGAGATLALGADFTNSSLNLRLDGGTLLLGGHQLTVGALDVTGNSTIDFDAGANSVLTVNSLALGAPGIGLTVQNWADATDYFYSHTAYTQGSAPLNQVTFQGWSGADTKWQSFDSEVTPVPEIGHYGTWLLGGLLAAGLVLSRRFDRTAA